MMYIRISGNQACSKQDFEPCAKMLSEAVQAILLKYQAILCAFQQGYMVSFLCAEDFRKRDVVSASSLLCSELTSLHQDHPVFETVSVSKNISAGEFIEFLKINKSVDFSKIVNAEYSKYFGKDSKHLKVDEKICELGLQGFDFDALDHDLVHGCLFHARSTDVTDDRSIRLCLKISAHTKKELQRAVKEVVAI